MDDQWRFIVRVLGSYTVLHGTDDESQAVRFCMESDKPCKVIRTSDDETIYSNC